jgi:fatty-acyl-CoA synthase
MLEGLVQNDYQLTIGSILERMRSVHHGSSVVTLREPGRLTRIDFGALAERVDKLAGALQQLGVQDGDRVATLMWNTQEHLELYYAIPSIGAVLHTLNLRLFSEQLSYIINHAEDTIIFVDDSLVEVLAKVIGDATSVRHVVVVGDGDGECAELPGALRYEELLAAQPAGFDYPQINERAAAGLCYTSGTTGNPKGVLYSHRSSVLHAVGGCMADTHGICWHDRILPVVPMFHANAWGLPYVAGMAGADMIMPSRFLQPEPLVTLIETERVTVAGAVPTIWWDVLRYADQHHSDLSSLRTVPCGGAAVPRSLMEAFHDRHGVEIIQAWGMTEMSPIGSVARPPRGVTGEAAWEYRSTAGRVAPMVEARIVDADDQVLPWGDPTIGDLEVRGPWIASAYFGDDSGEKFHDGWLRTGDMASIDLEGYIRIGDRSKDVIKSGGEWISSVELENELMGHPAVLEAAVIAKPDEKWSERPLACVVPEPDASLSAEELTEFLRTRVAKWWLPDEYAFIDEVPKTSVGKFDKKVLRARLAAGELAGRVNAHP